MPDTDQTSSNDTINAFLSSMPEDTAPAPDETVAPAELEAKTEAPLEPQVTPVVPEATAPKEPEARAYRKLLDGEAKLRAERKAYEAERQSHEAELAQFRALQGKAKADPIGHLMSLGLSDKEVLEAMQEAHARDLGNLAPPEVRAQLAAKRAERVAAETKAEIEARYRAENDSRAQAEGERYVAQYQAGITQFVSSGLTDYPQLAAVSAAGKPVAQAMYQTAVEMAAANPNGPSPTYAQVAQQLNAQLLELASFVAPAPTVTAPIVDPQTSTPGKPILRNSSTQAQPSPAADAKPKSHDEYVKDIRSRVYAAHGINTR